MDADLKSRYDRDGYVLLRGFMSTDEVAECLAVLRKMIRDNTSRR